jgi:hypothetical protein
MISDGHKGSLIIYGLFLQGAKYDLKEGYLIDPDPGILSYKMPEIIVIP